MAKKSPVLNKDLVDRICKGADFICDSLVEAGLMEMDGGLPRPLLVALAIMIISEYTGMPVELRAE